MPQVEGGPRGLNSILESAYASARAQGHDKGSASAIAWTAAKEEYKKQGGKWIRKVLDDLKVLVMAKSDVNWLYVGDVLVNPYNRDVDKNKVASIKRSIEESGKVKPLVYAEVDKDGRPADMITDGHHRYLALKELGYKYIPAVVSGEDGVETARNEEPVDLRKEVLSVDVPGLELVREDLGIRGKKPHRKLPEADALLDKMRARRGEIGKGGPGSGCQGPNCGRPSSGNKAYDEPFHSGGHVKQFLDSNNVVIASVDKGDLSPEKNALRQQQFEEKLKRSGTPYKKGRGVSSEWGNETSYIVQAESPEAADKLRRELMGEYKQDAVINIRNGHATMESRDGGVKHANTSKLEAGEQLTDNYTEVDGVRFRLNFR